MTRSGKLTSNNVLDAKMIATLTGRNEVVESVEETTRDLAQSATKRSPHKPAGTATTSSGDLKAAAIWQEIGFFFIPIATDKFIT